MTQNASYRRLLSFSGPVLPACSFLARMPQAMSQIGVLLLMDSTRGSLGSAGLVTGALAVGQAAGGPLIGRLTDHRGQRTVATVSSLANAVMLVLLVIAAAASAPLWVCAVAAAATGASVPPVGPLARTRWVHLLRREQAPAALTSTAFSLEGALDELSFVAGPTVVGLLATAAGPTVALLSGAVLVGVCGTAFALHRTAATTGPVASSAGSATGRAAAPPAPPAPRRPLLARPLLLALLAAMVLQGVIFSSVQTGATSIAGAAGEAGAAGLIYACMGITSAVAGLGTAALPGRFAMPARLRASTLSMLVVSVPLVLLAHGVGSLTAVLPFFGLAVGPYMITVFSLAERVVPGDRLATAMGMLNSAVVLGYALGSSVAGNLADVHGATGALLVTGSAALIAWVLALAAGGRFPADRSAAAATGVDGPAGRPAQAEREQPAERAEQAEREPAGAADGAAAGRAAGSAAPGAASSGTAAEPGGRG